MLTINLFDNEFPRQESVVMGKTPRLMQYARGLHSWDGITVFTDRMIYDPVVDTVRSDIKIAWLVEGKCFRPWNYVNIPSVIQKFDFVMTYDAELLRQYPDKAIFTLRGGSLIPKEQWRLYPKSKNVSMILSDKYSTEGHLLRHEIARLVPGIDLYGPEHVAIGRDKAIALRDYRFSIVVEACKEHGLFTEHLLDCIAFGTIPIYWGCTRPEYWLDVDGLLEFWKIKDLESIMPELDNHWHRISSYDSREYNLEMIAAYEIPEDWQVEHVYMPILDRVLA